MSGACAVGLELCAAEEKGLNRGGGGGLGL